VRRAGVAAAVAAVSALLLLVVIGSEERPFGATGLPGVVCVPREGQADGSVGGFSGSQLANAAAIVAAGVEMGVPQRALVIAIATAMQESRLYNYANATVPESLSIPHERVGSDHDSVGLFQQRASWGPIEHRMDPRASARLFYERLLAVPGWESLPLTQAAQRVQISAFPDAYAKWEQRANEVVGAVSGIVCPPGARDGGVLPANPWARVVVQRALSQIGVPYAWGGGNAHGPTRGAFGPDAGVVGFDCSGLMVYAFAAIGVGVPHQTQAIWAQFQPPITDPNAVQPGDMVLLSYNGQPTGIHHVGLYLGEGRVVHAPESGSAVQIVENIWGSPYWSGRFIGAVRAIPNADLPPPGL